MPRLTDNMACALRSLRAADATGPETAVEGGHYGANLWNRLYGAGLVGRRDASAARVWWLRPEGAAALAAQDPA